MKQSREPGYYGSKLADSLHELNEASAELRSLKQSILESPLKDYFPKKEGISFHDAVVFAIHKLGESKGELPTEEICIKVISQRIKSEWNKHHNLEWNVIAAKKIYGWLKSKINHGKE